MLAEAIGGWLTNSLALVADAGHMLTDVGALGLTLFAILFAARPATSRKTYGYYRIEILAAFINGIALVLLSGWIIYESIHRWQSPQPIKGVGLTMIAAGGLLVNLIAAYLLHSDQKNDLNMRGAWLHVIGDLLGSVTAIIAGVLIIAFGWLWADAACSALISVIIIAGAWRLIMESVNVLLEGTPSHIDLGAVEDAILATNGIEGVHDLHIWTISSGIEALSAHVHHGEKIVQADLLKGLRARLHDDFGIDHLTIQMETLAFEDEKVHFCETGTKCFESAGKSRLPRTVLHADH